MTRAGRRRLGAAALLAGALSCGSVDRGTVARIQLSAEAGLMKGVALVFTFGDQSRRYETPFPPERGGPLTIGLTNLPASLSGMVLVVALHDAADCVVGEGSQALQLQAGKTIDASIVVRPVPVRCGGGSDGAADGSPKDGSPGDGNPGDGNNDGPGGTGDSADALDGAGDGVGTDGGGTDSVGSDGPGLDAIDAGPDQGNPAHECRRDEECPSDRYCGLLPSGVGLCAPKNADGVTCTADGQCLSGACGSFLPDADGDSFGDRSAALVRTCGTVPPAGHVLSTQGGDCCDRDAAVKPCPAQGACDSRAFRDHPTVCGGWDYDCDGAETPSLPADYLGMAECTRVIVAGFAECVTDPNTRIYLCAVACGEFFDEVGCNPPAGNTCTKRLDRHQQLCH